VPQNSAIQSGMHYAVLQPDPSLEYTTAK